MDFIIDTKGDVTNNVFLEKPNPITESLSNSEMQLKNALNKFKSTFISSEEATSIISSNLEGSSVKKRKGKDEKKQKEINAILSKSVVLNPEFEQLQTIPKYDVSKRRLRDQRKLEREKTKGAKWFNMPATKMTDEIKQDLQVLKMRSVLDPKHFYKKNDLKVLPKYFQVGKVIDSPLDYYNRVPHKERKKTLVDELLANAEFNKYNKRKYKEIIEQRQKTHYKAWKQAKRLKRKNKKK